MRYGFAKAYAKVNLTLDVLGLRDDGYHDLRMVMQSVSLHDSVSVRIGCGEDVATVSNVRHIPNDDRNIVIKATRAFLDATGIDCGGVYIAVEKRIPSSAGMAGGSADGAAVLRLLNELTEAGLSDEKLCEIGVGVGADIPFCLMGGTSLAEARGEVLTPLSPLAGCIFVIAKPGKGMSTKNVFAAIDSEPVSVRPDTDGMINAVRLGNIAAVSEKLCNVFEPVVTRQAPEILRIKEALCENGALSAVMTGSGSAVFGIFEDGTRALSAKNELSKKYDEVFVARPVDADKVRNCTEIFER
ncbi:MAG: 4-(cytidine 5'-diphospho)-2-C-methyl-D-erythritol kinase [Oscillospiraceae bacterium]|nr:4-(cytidine 5'-diphospho)-2-C-methyl-D-erythritol kinase [Oscillospiraceae bacterium]